MSKKEFIELLKNKGIILSDKQIEQFFEWHKGYAVKVSVCKGNIKTIASDL